MKIAITNLKGGVGKTTITQNLAVCLAHMGYRVCVVDTDTNQNTLAWYGVRSEELPNLNVVGSTDPKALIKTVGNLHNDYDIILIDGTPSLGEMTTRVILASDLLLIPILPGANDFRAMEHFFERYNLAQETAAKEIPAYFLLNQYSDNVRLHTEIKELLEQFGLPIMNTTIRNRVSYVASAVEGTGVYEGSDNKAKLEMVELTNEVLKIAAEAGLVTHA